MLLAGFTADAIIFSNDTLVVVVAGNAGDSAVSGDVTITSDTGASGASPSAWEYVAPGKIDSVVPVKGQAGTWVTIQGSQLAAPGRDIVSVILSDEVTNITFANASYITVRVPITSTAATKTGDVVIIDSAGGHVILKDGWSFLLPGTIAAVEPGRAVSGADVTIYGQSLLGGGDAIVSVSLAGINATIKRMSDFVTEVTAGLGTKGLPGDVVVTADTGATISLASAFEYIEPGNIVSIIPTRGVAGTLVTLTGTDLFSGGSSLSDALVCDIVAEIVFANSTLVFLRLGVPQSMESFTGNVVLTSSSGSKTTSVDNFIYLNRPEIHSIEPAVGHEGTYVTIQGRELLGGARVQEVRLGTHVPELISENNETVIVRVLDGAKGDRGVALEIVSTTGSTVQRNGAWTFAEQATVTLASPEKGVGGTVVQIYGFNLLMASVIDEVTLAGVHAKLMFANDTSIFVELGVNTSAPLGKVYTNLSLLSFWCSRSLNHAHVFKVVVNHLLFSLDFNQRYIRCIRYHQFFV